MEVFIGNLNNLIKQLVMISAVIACLELNLEGPE